MRTLMVSSRAGIERDGWPPIEDLRRLIAEGRMNNVLALHDAIGVTVLDGRYVDAQVPALARRLPFRVAEALEIARRREDFDAVLTWGERDAARVGGLMQLLPRRPAHVSILFWLSNWRKALPLRIAHRGVDRMVIPSPLQYKFARETLRLPASKTVHIPWPIDTAFWQAPPHAAGGDLISAVGFEMRDWETLIEALRPLAIPCHIAAGNKRVTVNLDAYRPPEHVTVGVKPVLELRELYARSRFVVVPLLPTDSDQGITTVLEAMAMRRAVICTDTSGQVGVLENEVNSIRVPPRDPDALRRAIERLWADPGLCARLGAEGRRLVEERHGLDRVIPRISALVGEAIGERRRR